MGPVELAKVLGVTSAASSGVVDRLGRGHAERRPHPGDGRRTEVVITDSGRAEVMTLMTPMFRGLAEIDTALSDRDREVVEALPPRRDRRDAATPRLSPPDPRGHAGKAPRTTLSAECSGRSSKCSREMSTTT